MDEKTVHLLQKKALRILVNNEYISHTEPICKELCIIKAIGMFRLLIGILYYKLMNNALPPYFDANTPVLTRIVNLYIIRRASFHLPKIRYEFAEHLIYYCQ